MGRTARNYPKGKLKLRTPKEVQSGKRYPVYIEYNWQADSLRKTTEVSLFPKDWNEKGYGGIGEIRTTTDLDYKYYNAVLHKRLTICASATSCDSLLHSGRKNKARCTS